MSKLTDELNSVDVFNAYEFAGHGNPYISFTAATRGMASRSARYSVVRPGYKTDPQAHWMDNGSKTFGCYDRDKAGKLAEAMAWAGARYNITEWAKTPFGSWMDATFVKTRLAELKAQVKAVKKAAAV